MIMMIDSGGDIDDNDDNDDDGLSICCFHNCVMILSYGYILLHFQLLLMYVCHIICLYTHIKTYINISIYA